MGIPGSATNQVCSRKSACDFCKLQQTPWVCCFAEILQICVAYQVFGRMCRIVYLAYPLKLSIQTLLFVAPTRSVFWRTTQFQQNEHTPGILYNNFKYQREALEISQKALGLI